MTAIPQPSAAAVLARAKDADRVISVRRLMWLRFRRNRLAMLGGAVLIVIYTTALFAGFVAPYDAARVHRQFVSAPPTALHFVDADGNFHLIPFVYGLDAQTNPATFRREYTPKLDERHHLQFFIRGDRYLLLGLIETDIHLFGVEEPGVLFLLGTDRLGRDVFSRVLYGAQVSLSVGFIGVVLTLIFGTLIGIAAGYFGGFFDAAAQRVIEVLLAFPQLPLWLSLAALIPPNWPSDRVYFAISIVLSILNWGALARQVRSMVFALRESDYVVAARYANCSDWRIITRHLLPNTTSHIIVIATTAIPAMILGETALSFLGLGIKPPLVSWGLLLNEAQQTRVLLQQPWLLSPAIFVIVTIISFNFLGDGLRDAADPFAK